MQQEKLVPMQRGERPIPSRNMSEAWEVPPVLVQQRTTFDLIMIKCLQQTGRKIMKDLTHSSLRRAKIAYFFIYLIVHFNEFQFLYLM